jgi:hypothetical protein
VAGLIAVAAFLVVRVRAKLSGALTRTNVEVEPA